MLPTLVRELISPRTLPREPEPDLVMEGDDQVTAYTKAGRIDGVMAAAYLFHSARISQIIQGCRRVVDLGCGPATQLAQIAGLNPDVSFLGVDLSERMLADAKAHVQQLGLTNMEFEQGDITALETLPEQSADGVISTMALHHLPTLHDLQICFGQIGRILSNDGALYLVDFGRLKSLKSVLFFAYMNRKYQPHLFSLDYERSLRAAFLREDLVRAAAEELPKNARVYSTFAMPILTVVKTADKPINDTLRQRLRKMRKGLLPRYRRELDDIRLLFRLGGLHNDPFR